MTARLSEMAIHAYIAIVLDQDLESARTAMLTAEQLADATARTGAPLGAGS